MGVRKIILATALALTVVLAFSGCAVTGSLVDKARLDFELTKLSSALEEIPAVDTVIPTLELQADYSYWVSVRVMTAAPTEHDTISILHAVDSAFSDGALSTQPAWFYLDTESGVLVEQGIFGLPDDQVAADVHYLFALTGAYGAPMTMGIGGWDGPTDPGKYQRSITGTDEVTEADWTALRAIPDPSPSSTNTWGLLGIATTGSLPPDDVVRVLELLAPVLPADGEGHAWMSWDGERFNIQISPSAEQTGAFVDMTLWPNAVAIASVLAESELPASTFALHANSMSNTGAGTVHIRECAFEAAAERDQEFVVALVASGVVLPPGSGAGYC